MNTNTRTATWTSIGTDVKSANNNLDMILSEAGLDYTVSSRPVTVEGEILPNYHAIVRDSDNHVYNIAKKSYHICQNQDAFSIVNEFNDNIKIVKAGEAENGMIYLIGEMPEITVLDDVYKLHIILQNSHNAEFALKAAVIPLRIVCENQFNVAFSEAPNTFTVKHTSIINDRVAEMNHILSLTVHYARTFRLNAESLAAKSMDFDTFLDAIIPIDSTMTPRRIDNIEHQRTQLITAYNEDDNANFRGTAWGAMNAAMDFATHKPHRGSDEGRFITSILYPDFTRRVHQYLMAV